MGFSFATPRARRRPSLTPMIDVVFLLLVFFMLAARFGQDGDVSLGLSGGAGATWSGPPRLLEVTPDTLSLNGRMVSDDALFSTLSSLVETEADLILLRSSGDTDLQRLLDVITNLQAAGFSSLALIE